MDHSGYWTARAPGACVCPATMPSSRASSSGRRRAVRGRPDHDREGTRVQAATSAAQTQLWAPPPPVQSWPQGDPARPSARGTRAASSRRGHARWPAGTDRSPRRRPSSAAGSDRPTRTARSARGSPTVRPARPPSARARAARAAASARVRRGAGRRASPQQRGRVRRAAASRARRSCRPAAIVASAAWRRRTAAAADAALAASFVSSRRWERASWRAPLTVSRMRSSCAWMRLRKSTVSSSCAKPSACSTTVTMSGRPPCSAGAAAPRALARLAQAGAQAQRAVALAVAALLRRGEHRSRRRPARPAARRRAFRGRDFARGRALEAPEPRHRARQRLLAVALGSDPVAQVALALLADRGHGAERRSEDGENEHGCAQAKAIHDGGAVKLARPVRPRDLHEVVRALSRRRLAVDT